MEHESGQRLRVARATGVVLLAAAEAGLTVEERAARGQDGRHRQRNRRQARVRGALAALHGLRDVPRQTDAADAVAIALCHLSQTALRRAARAVGQP